MIVRKAAKAYRTRRNLDRLGNAISWIARRVIVIGLGVLAYLVIR